MFKREPTFKPKQSVADIFNSFTKDLNDLVAREDAEAARQEALEAAAREAKLISVQEASTARRAVDNILAMLQGGRS